MCRAPASYWTARLSPIRLRPNSGAWMSRTRRWHSTTSPASRLHAKWRSARSRAAVPTWRSRIPALSMTQTTKFRQERNASPGLSARSAYPRASQCSPIPSVSKATASRSEKPARNLRYGRYRSTTLSIPDSVETHYAQPRCKLASVVDDQTDQRLPWKITETISSFQANSDMSLIPVNTWSRLLWCHSYNLFRNRGITMYKRITLAVLSTFALGTSAVAAQPNAEELRARANNLFKPIPTAEVVVKEKGLTPEQIELGQWLFFEPRLSKSHIITCNTCHSVGTGGADNIPTSVGHGWQHGPRNSPTVLNAVFNAAQFWDGRAADLAEQAKGPVQASVEMNATPQHVEDTLRSIPQYVEKFAAAFPKDKNPVSFDNMAKAIEAFESTLTTPNSRMDQFLMGKDTLNGQELTGLKLFIDKGCVACHSGVNFGGQNYYPFGL